MSTYLFLLRQKNNKSQEPSYVQGQLNTATKVSFLSAILTIYHFPTEFSNTLFTGLFALQLTEESVLTQTTLSITVPHRSFGTCRSFPAAGEEAQDPAGRAGGFSPFQKLQFSSSVLLTAEIHFSVRPGI